MARATTKISKTTKKPAAVPKKTKAVKSVKSKTPEKRSTAKEKAPEKVQVAKPSGKVASSRSIQILSVEGTSVGKMELPEELFAAKVNKQILAQAIRVYLANQREGTASTKTRGEVRGSTRKIYRQKGTGRARHGGIRAPIFVGGGITFGPKPRDYSLKMPQKMRRVALASALTTRLGENVITVVDGLESLEPKTKKMYSALTALGRNSEKVLVVTDVKGQAVVRMGRNIPGVEITEARNLNTYQVMSNKKLIFTKNSIAELKQTFVG